MKGSGYSTIHDFDWKATKLLLKHLGIRQIDLAVTLGVSKLRLNHILNGYRYPPIEMFLRLADILGVPPHGLQYRHFDKRPQTSN